MNRIASVVLSVLVMLAFSACGYVHTATIKPAHSAQAPKEVVLAPVQVTSVEQNADALSLDAQWNKMASDQLQAMLAGRKIAVVADAPTTVLCRIQVRYGNRAARYFVGFGAGRGDIDVSIVLQDKDGKALYSTDSKAHLAVGLFGGGMSGVVSDAIQAAVTEFGAKL